MIEASPQEILDVIADIESAPAWSPHHQGAEVLDTYADGRPRRAKLRVKAAGFTDVQDIEYDWTGTTAGWKLIKGTHLKSQECRYTLVASGDKTNVRFDLKVDPVVPVPALVVKRTLARAMGTATDGLRDRVLSVKKGVKKG